MIKLGGSCAQCGFTDIRALQIDHKNGDGSAQRREIGGLHRMYRDILKNPVPYQLLCANCNWIKRYENGEAGEVYQHINLDLKLEY